MSALSKLVDIPTADPDDARRRKVVNILVLFLAAVAIVQISIVLVLEVLGLPLPAPLSDPKFRLQAYVASAAVLALCALIYAINRRSGLIAGAIFSLLVGVALYFNIPDNPVMASTTFALTVSVVCTTLFVHSAAGFVMAAVSTMLIAIIGARIGVGFYLASAGDFFGIALCCWFAARSLERALRDLRILNVELDQRVQDRTRELAESLAKNQAILDSTADGIIVFDDTGKAIVANPAINGLLERTTDAIAGRNINTLMGDDVDAEGREMIVSLLSDTEKTHSGVKFRWGRKTLSVSLAPVRDNSGRVTGTVAAFRDFTKEAEIDRMKSTFVSIASHELRTPLNAILGYTEMLQDEVYGPLSEQQRGVLGRVVANTGHLLSLANNLLDRAQMEAGKITLNITTFAPADLISGVVGVMDVLAQAKGLQLTSHIADDVPARASSDRQRLHQILINLTGNAIKYTEEGMVRVRAYVPDPGHWALEVTDTGPGIPKEAQSYIFEPFRRVDGSATREQGGAGLGLSIVKQLVTLMEGEVKLESEVGKGSTFTIILPITASNATDITGYRPVNVESL